MAVLSQRFGPRARKALFIVLLKLCLSAGFFYWIWTALPDGTDWMELRLVHPFLLLICIMAVVLQNGLLAFRWLKTTRQITDVSQELPAFRFWRFFQLTWLSQAISQVLPALVGGDGFRIAGLHYDGVPLGTSTKSVIADRLLGLAGLLVLIIPGIAASGLMSQPPLWVIAVAAVCALVAAAFVYSARHWLATGFVRYGGGLQRLFGVDGLALLVMAIAGHGFSVLIFQLLSTAYGIDIPVTTTLIVFPAALLMSILPISLGGWGVREASVVYGLSKYGIPEHDALLASLIFGTFQVCAAIPSIGGILSWARRNRK